MQHFYMKNFLFPKPMGGLLTPKTPGLNLAMPLSHTTLAHSKSSGRWTKGVVL